jgi:uncharacterized membrane protein
LLLIWASGDGSKRRAIWGYLWFLFLILVLGFACGAWVGFGFAVFLAFPCIVIGLLALPLCGAAPTSLCRRKEK